MTEKRSPEATPYTPATRLLLEIAYDGSEYCGWQIQYHSPSVQEIAQETLTKLYRGLPIHLIGSSRTDTGVHALGFAASYLVPEQPWIPLDRIQTIINRRLPPSIRIMSAREVPISFHTRYDALGKAYTYVFNNGPETPFSGRYSWATRRRLNYELIREAAQLLIGTHDFSSFVVERSAIDDAVRTIYSIEVEHFGEFTCVTFKGNGFLYKMIRSLAGLLEAVGAGVVTVEAAEMILAARSRSMAPETAPSRGLFLMKVFFDEAEIAPWKLDAVPFFR